MPSFVTATSFIVGSSTYNSKPVAVAVGDFNGDGKADVVTANEAGPGVTVLLGTGRGTFLPRHNYATGPSPDGILVADVNGDGRLDVVTPNTGDDTVSVLLGKGDGTFKAAASFAAGADPSSVAVGDVNGDGRNDLVVANGGASTVTVLRGAPKGKFISSGTVTVGNNPTSVVLADFNNDSKLDIASVSGGFGNLEVNLGNGDGTFAAKVHYATGFVAHTLVVGDFNDDSQPDLAIACDFPSGDGVSILLGNPDGTFQAATNYNVGGNPTTLAIGDLNGDGIQDLVTANKSFANNTVSVITGTGTGAFSAPQLYTAGKGPFGVAIADFNSDGRPDVVAANHDEAIGSISLLRGNGDGTLSAAPDLLLTESAGPTVAVEVTGDAFVDLVAVTSNKVTIFPGNGNGTFAAPLLTAAINQANALAVRDLNGDQKKDLIVTTSNGNVDILLGNGDGTFATPVAYAAGSSPKWVAVADFNKDSKLDLAVANGENGVSILLGNGDGTFGAATGVVSGGNSDDLEAGDFNRDGNMDLAVALDGTGGPAVSVLFGKGDGTFKAPKLYATQVGPGTLGLGDFNHDGKLDIEVPTFFGSTVTIFRNTTAGAFTHGPVLTANSLPTGSVVADINGDGKLDIAVVNTFSYDLYVFAGKGDGKFARPKKYVVGAGPNYVTAADFNGDGKLDLAAVAGNKITLLETPTGATHFRVSVVPSTTAGASFQVVVTAQDALGRLARNFTGTVRLSSSDGKAVLPLAYQFTAADAGVKRFTVTLKTAGTQSIVATSGGITGNDSVDVVAARVTHFTLVAPPTVTVGTPFDLTVTARDAFNNVVLNYLGTVQFASTASSQAGDLPTNYAFQATDNGTKTFTVTLRKTGLQTVNVTDVLKPTLKKSLSVKVFA